VGGNPGVLIKCFHLFEFAENKEIDRLTPISGTQA
jgi:hypothetical protein